MNIKESYSQKLYVETDDICNFLGHTKESLYQMIESLNAKEDQIAIDSIMEQVFEVILTIHKKIENKVDILEEFNIINEILGDFNPNSGLKHKLETLRKISDQCKIYASRPFEELNLPRRTQEDDIIKREDYEFLLE